MKKYTLIQDFLAKTFLVVFAFFSMQMVAQTTAVSVFNYPGLNSGGSSCDNENENLIGIISAIPTYTVDVSINSFSDPVTLATQLSASEFFFMTDMETQSPSSTTFLPLASRDVIKNWVNNGGVMVMTGTFGSNDTNFLNLIFSWDLGTARSVSSWAKNTANTLGTPFENGPLSLPYEDATDAISKGTVPNFKAMWGTDSSATVAVIKYGAGSVIFMGYDFYDAGPRCNRNSSPWVQGVIPSALNYAVELVGNSIIDFNNITTSYGSANFDLAASSNSGGNITYSILGTNTTGTTLSGTNNKTVTVGNTGSVVIRATQAADGAYTATTKDITLTISPVAITITADTKSKVYGDVDPALTYQLTSGALVAGDAFTGSLTRRVGEDVANYAIAAGTVSAGSNYTMSFVSSDLSITPKAIAITAEAKSKVYGDVDPALTYQATLVGTDFLTGSLTRAAGENVGSYAISSTLANSNYDITFVPANLAITKKSVTVTADVKTKVYGDVDPALTYQATLLGTDVLTGSLTRAAGENVGSYAISSTLANSNYDITFVPANLAITKKSVTVTADVKTKVYGDVDPALTYQATLVGTDVLTGSLTRAAGENVGSYVISSTLANSNYDITFVPDNLVITKKSVTVTADAKTKVYGDVDPALTYQLTSGALVAGDAFTGSLTRSVGENVANYAIAAGTVSAGSNYTMSFVPSDLSITPKAITITAEAKTKVYGDVDPALTYQLTSGALVAGDAFTGTLTRVTGENTGTYAIGQGNLNAGPNYAIKYNDAVFAINKANQIITWNQILESGCDGVTKITLTASTSSGLPLSFTPSNGNVASVLNGVLNFNNYGETTITVSQFGNNNYNAAQTIVLPALYTQPNLIRKHFDDVIFFDNSSKSYKSFTWYKNGEVVPSQTAQYFKENGVLNGVYYAKATKTDGTVVTSCSLTFSPSTEVEYLKIAPNPVKSNSEYQILTNIDSVKLKNARITVFNLLGVQIIDKEISEKTLDMIAPTTEGIYVVRLTLANGKYFTKNLLVRN